MSYANNKGADQPAHPRSLISALIVRCLNSVMSLVSVTTISSLMLASIAEEASLSLTWSETHDEAQVIPSVRIPDDNFKSLGPIPSNPVALDVSREGKNCL